MFKWMIRIIFAATIFALALITFFIFFAKSPKGEKWLRLNYQELAKKNGLDIEIQNSSNVFPLRWTLNNVYIQLNTKDTLHIKRMHARISPLSLFKGSIDIAHLHIDELTYSYGGSSSIDMESIAKTIDAQLPVGIRIRSLFIDMCTLNDLDMQETLSLSLQGSFHKNKNATQLSCLIKAREIQNPLKGIACTIKKKHHFFYASCNLHSNKLAHLLLHKDLPDNIDAHIILEGPWLLYKDPLHLTAQLKAAPWELHANADLFIDGSMHIDDLSLRNPFLHIEGEGDLGKQGKVKNARLSCHIDDLSHLHSLYTGSLEVQATYSPQAWQLLCESPNLGTKHHTVQQFFCLFSALPQDETWKVSCTGSALDQELPIELQSTFLLTEQEHILVETLKITAQDTLITGSCACTLSPFVIEGSLHLTTTNFNLLTRWLPGAHGKGSIDATLSLSPNLTAHALFEDIEIYNLSAQKGEIHFVWPEGSGSLIAHNVAIEEAHLDTISIDTHSTNGTLSFDARTHGSWKGPVEIHTIGTWTPKKESTQISITRLEGCAFNQNVSLQNPLEIHASKTNFTYSPSTIHIGEGSFTAQADLGETASSIHIHAHHLPLKVFSAFSSDLSLYGSSSFELCLQEDSAHATNGMFHLILEGADITHKGKSDPLRARGSIQGHIENGILQTYTHFQASGGQFLESNMTLPLSCNLFPFQISLCENHPLSAEITMEGRIEEVFDFIHMGSHHIQGLLSCRLFISKTWHRPIVTGSLYLQEGTYENYFTGTDLRHIEATVVAEKDTLALNSLHAQDKKGGKLQAQGKLLLLQDEGFPFTIEASLDNLGCVHTDMVSADLSGPLYILGNKKSMQATGTLQVMHADCHIPDSLPSQIAVIPVSYVNMPKIKEQKIYMPPTIFPLYLDIHLHAPSGIFVRGRGLDAEWKGSLHLTGTQTAVNATGACDLIKGDFLFSGKTFSLSQGEITLSDKPTQSAFLSLSGSLTLPDQMTITAQLRGPLSSPQLTFHSIPHQPTSSILSHILFNKDISEITPFQAIQLAQAVVTLSGTTGPNVLEAIRKTLGVDKLNIVSSSEGADVSLQIGKYLTKGVMVSLTQGANSSNVTVEVELRPGLSFEAETQDQEEGKFSLKWHKRY